MGLRDFFKTGLFSRKKRAPLPDPKEQKKRLDEKIDGLLRKCRKRLEELLITRKVERGSIKKTSTWELFRSNPGLYRIDAPGVSILLHTAPFLIEGAAPKQGTKKVQGLLQIKEIELCKAALSSKSLADFLRHAEAPSVSMGQEIYDRLLSGSERQCETERLPSLSELLAWQPFDLDQMLARNTENTLAHVLIQADPKLELLLRSRLSFRLAQIVQEELEALLMEKTDGRFDNPHSKQRPLQDFEAALREFQGSMQAYLHEKQKSRHPSSVMARI